MSEKYYLTLPDYQFAAIQTGHPPLSLAATIYTDFDNAKKHTKNFDGMMIFELKPILKTRLETHYEDVNNV